jgi:hypothetical protein
LASRKFRLGFDRKFGRYITELDLSDLCTRRGMDATIVLAAVPMLPNVHTIVVPSLDDVVEMVADVESDSDDESNAGEDGPEVAFVTNSLLELLASVPSLVASLSDLSENEDFFRRLATKSPQTKQLVLYDYELAFPDRLVGFALDALRSCPQLSDLKLVIMEEVDDCEALRQFVLPPGCRLRHLSLTTYSGYTTGMCKLVGKLAPVLQSLDLDFQAFRPSERTGLAKGVQFPHLETLLVTTGHPASLGKLTASLSPVQFPVLRHLELRARSPGNRLPPAIATNVTGAFAARDVPFTVVVDRVSTDVRRYRVDDSPLPATTRPDRDIRPLVPENILRDPFSQDASGDLWPQHDHLAFYSRDVLEPLLNRMRDMLHEAVQTNDYVQLSRVAHALQRCELLRIERDT